MNKFVIKRNRKKMYVSHYFEFNGMIVPLFDDELDYALVFENKKEAEKLLKILSKNFNSLVLQEI